MAKIFNLKKKYIWERENMRIVRPIEDIETQIKYTYV